MPAPACLRISRYGEGPGFYLLYLDPTGEELTDTWHLTLGDAMPSDGRVQRRAARMADRC